MLNFCMPHNLLQYVSELQQTGTLTAFPRKLCDQSSHYWCSCETVILYGTWHKLQCYNSCVAMGLLKLIAYTMYIVVLKPSSVTLPAKHQGWFVEGPLGALTRVPLPLPILPSFHSKATRHVTIAVGLAYASHVHLLNLFCITMGELHCKCVHFCLLFLHLNTFLHLFVLPNGSIFGMEIKITGATDRHFWSTIFSRRGKCIFFLLVCTTSWKCPFLFQASSAPPREGSL